MRLLHITDLHILTEPGKPLYGGDTFVSLSRVLREAFSLSPQPDCILATGDLVETPSAETYLRLRKLLRGFDVPIYVIPGNHDSVELMRDHLVGEQIRFQSFAEVQEWGLLLLDSQVTGESYGEITAQERSEIRQSLQANPERPVLVALHHTAIPPCPSPGCALREREAFLEMLSSFPSVKIVVGGHAHLDARMTHGHIALFTTPSTCSQGWHAQLGEASDHVDFWNCHRFDASRHGFRIFELEANGDFSESIHWIEQAPN